MKLWNTPTRARESRRGAALMLSFLVLIVLILIVQQISYSARTDARVSRNAEALMIMDVSIESALLQVYEDLKADAEASAGGGDSGGGEPFSDGGGEEGGGGGGASDSREDGWARPQRTEINDIQLRIFVQDEDSKFNVLSIMNEDEEEAELAFDRLVEVLIKCREGTSAEIDSGDAREMADVMREFMTRRQDQFLPDPELLSDAAGDGSMGLPQSLRDFAALDPELFTPNLFIDYRDEQDEVVHSIEAFLTVYSSLTQGPPQEEDEFGGEDQDSTPDPGANPDGQQDGGQPIAGGSDPSEDGGGESRDPEADGRVNINTAPAAVLHSLADPRDVPYNFWDDVLEYRNEADEESEDLDADEIPLDEYGEEIVTYQFFDSIDALGEIDGWLDLEPETRDDLRNRIKISSSVFSIYITARQLTGSEDLRPGDQREDIERAELESPGLIRTVRSIVWRRQSEGGEAEIIPLVRWQVVDYVPFEVLDFPDEDR